jgi:uncharacterized protein (UPF0332 family)
MNRDLILAEWRRAGEALRAAEILARANCHVDAVSRCYYAVFHAAKAALLVHDVVGESHAAVRRLFGLHLIHTGEIEKVWAANLAESLDDRLAADYDAESNFSEEEVSHDCRRARSFIQRIRRFLLSSGFTQSELRKRKL